MQEEEKTKLKVSESEILTAQETMKLFKMSRNTFDKLKEEGVIKVYRFPIGRKLYCKYSELIAALEEVQEVQ